jgi:FAD/FMN-containing dehydrogenase
MALSYQHQPIHPPHHYEPIPNRRVFPIVPSSWRRRLGHVAATTAAAILLVLLAFILAVVAAASAAMFLTQGGGQPRLTPPPLHPLLLGSSMGTSMIKTFDDDDVATTTNSFTTNILSPVQRAALLELNASMAGRVIFRDDDSAEYALVSRSWVRRVSQQPIALILVATESDIGLSLTTLRRHYIAFRIRSGGHHKLGYSTNTSVVLDLQHLNSIEWVDDDNLLRLGPAVTSSELYGFLGPQYNRSAVLGFCGSVAESGFVMGGGYGILSRVHGLGLDNVVSFRIVLANGSAVTANADLDWALRGAGHNNFGVVSSLTYRTHPIAQPLTVLSVRINSTSDRAAFLYHVGQLNPPGNLVMLHDAPHTVNLIWWGATDDEARGGETYMKELLPKKGDAVTYETFHLTWNAFYQPSFSNATWGSSVFAAACWTGFLMPENNTRAIWRDILHHIDAHVDDMYLLPDIELWGGAIAASAMPDRPDAAFPYRNAVYNVGVLLLVQEDDAALYEQKVAAVDRWWPNVSRHLQGTYVNYPMRDSTPRLMWGENLPRLTELKRRYDPDNLFRQPLGVPM